jgi:hypothetical protein
VPACLPAQCHAEALYLHLFGNMCAQLGDCYHDAAAASTA